MFEDGIEKVETGITTLQELFRVAAPPGKEDIYDRAKTEQTKKQAQI